MGRMGRGLWVFGLGLVLVGCWPAAGQGPDRRAFNPLETVISAGSVGSLEEAWTFGPVHPPDDPSGPVWVGSPVVSEGSGGGVHATIGDCAVVAVDRGTGQLSWILSLSEYSNEPLPCSPYVTEAQTPTGVTGGRLVVGRAHLVPDLSFEWLSIVLDQATGTVVDQDDVGLLHGLRGETALFFRDDTRLGVPFAIRTATVGSLTDPAARRDLVLDGFPGQGGTVDPELTLGEGTFFQAGPGLLATEPGSAARGNGVRGYSTTEARPGCGPTGGLAVECPVWATPIDGAAPTEPVIGETGDVVFVGTDNGTLYALDAADGTVLWTAALSAAIEAPPAVAYDTVFVPTADGRVVALPEDGCGNAVCEPIWQSSPGAGGAIRVQPAVANDVLFVAGSGDDGELRAFDATGCGGPVCDPTWSTTTGSPITGAPAVSNGYLYVGTSDGHLNAYTPSPG